MYISILTTLVATFGMTYTNFGDNSWIKDNVVVPTLFFAFLGVTVSIVVAFKTSLKLDRLRVNRS